MTNNTWVLLRGLARESGHWGAFAETFAQAMAPDKILTIDLPGAGEFREGTSPMSLSEIFQFVRAKVIERSGAHDKYSLFAISLGGMVAMEWMRQKPEDLNGCVLINTSDRGLSPTYNRLRWQIWPKFLKLVAQPQVREREKSLIDLLINSEEGRAAALPLWCKIAIEHPISYRTFINQLLAAARFQGLKEKSAVPVLLLNGLGDRLVDPSCSTVLNERWGWPLVRHAWAGHDMTWDDGEWVIAQTRAWRDG